MVCSGIAGRHQRQPRDLRRRAETFRRPPVTGAAARIDPELVQPREPGREWLLETHEEHPRPELTAVRVSRELQIEARSSRGCRAARLMCQQYLRAGIWRRASERR